MLESHTNFDLGPLPRHRPIQAGELQAGDRIVDLDELEVTEVVEVVRRTDKWIVMDVSTDGGWAFRTKRPVDQEVELAEPMSIDEVGRLINRYVGDGPDSVRWEAELLVQLADGDGTDPEWELSVASHFAHSLLDRSAVDLVRGLLDYIHRMEAKGDE